MSIASRASRARSDKRFWQVPQFRFGLVVLAPLLIWYLLFAFIPIGRTIWVSFQTFNALNPNLSRFSGLTNYQNIFKDPRFLDALSNSTRYVIYKNVLAIPLALGLALLMERTKRRQVYMFAYFLPGVMSLLGTAVLFKYFYDPTGGLFNGLLSIVGLPRQEFIRGEGQALFSVAAMDAWRSFGFYSLLLLAGLLDIPESYYDAAKVDGANNFRTLWHITFPLLNRTLLLVFVAAGIDGFQVFAAPYIMVGPGRSTLVLSQLIYTEGLRNVNLGYASAVAVVLFFIIMAVSFIQLRLLRTDWEH